MAKSKKKPALDVAKLSRGDRVQIPVALVEFEVGGNTLWVHSPNGGTVLRIKFPMGIRVDACGPLQSCSHMDVTILPGEVGQIPPTCCLASDAEA